MPQHHYPPFQYLSVDNHRAKNIVEEQCSLHKCPSAALADTPLKYEPFDMLIFLALTFILVRWKLDSVLSHLGINEST